MVEPGIVLAADLTPADTAALDRELVRGIATAYGGPTSHSAILARSLGIPAAVGLGEQLLDVPEGAPLALDGDAGAVVVDPAEELVRDYERRSAEREEEARRARASAQRPAQTRDGRRIEVVANVGSPEDVDAAVASGAEGVGLLRTEFLFLERDSVPTEDEQYAAYADIAERLQGRPLILRTLDVGADKPLPYVPRRAEANPFLGVRGIRLGLAQPELLETQLRAALRVAALHPLKVMFPMVTTLAEYHQAVSLLDRAREHLEERGETAGPMEVGIMVEVPAAALAADAFAPEVDFFSIGTNDLVQYTMAAERGNEAVAGLADGLHPAVLRLIRSVAAVAEAHGKWVGVCGELAADPLAVPVLVGLGVSELSVNPPAIPATKEAVGRWTRERPGSSRDEALRLSSAEDVRALVATAGGRGSVRDLGAVDAVSGQVLLGLTYLRILLIPVVMGLILLGPDRDWAYVAAAILFAIAATTDFVDGYLARRWALTTTFGSFLDTTADKLLVSGALIALVDVDRASVWIAIVIIGRELLILGLRGVVAAEGTVFAPSIWGKLKTNVQFIAILLAILRYDEPLGPAAPGRVGDARCGGDHGAVRCRVPGPLRVGPVRRARADRRHPGHRRHRVRGRGHRRAPSRRRARSQGARAVRRVGARARGAGGGAGPRRRPRPRGAHGRDARLRGRLPRRRRQRPLLPGYLPLVRGERARLAQRRGRRGGGGCSAGRLHVVGRRARRGARDRWFRELPTPWLVPVELRALEVRGRAGGGECGA